MVGGAALPLFTLQQPYWIGLLVHGSSAIMYPLRWKWRRAPAPDVRFAKSWITGAITAIPVLGILALFGGHGYKLPGSAATGMRTRLLSVTRGAPRSRHRSGADRFGAREGSASAKLDGRQPGGREPIFENWWLSWFDTEMPDCTGEERAAIPGFSPWPRCGGSSLRRLTSSTRFCGIDEQPSPGCGEDDRSDVVEPGRLSPAGDGSRHSPRTAGEIRLRGLPPFPRPPAICWRTMSIERGFVLPHVIGPTPNFSSPLWHDVSTTPAFQASGTFVFRWRFAE